MEKRAAGSPLVVVSGWCEIPESVPEGGPHPPHPGSRPPAAPSSIFGRKIPGPKVLRQRGTGGLLGQPPLSHTFPYFFLI